MNSYSFLNSHFDDPSTLIGHLPSEWETLMRKWNEPRYRALQIFRWIHQRGVFNPEQMHDLPKFLRNRLIEAGLCDPIRIAKSNKSSDRTTKLLLILRDTYGIETVLIPQNASSVAELYTNGEERNLVPFYDKRTHNATQCVSCQVGCAMGCRFCASGLFGFKRHMTAGEIVAQVLFGRGALSGTDRLGSIVFMGMGEPLHNYEAVARSIRLLHHPDGMNLSLRRITVSTCGLVPQIDRLAKDFRGHVQLAVSLHAANDDTRSHIMPIARRYPIRDLVRVLRRYPSVPNRRITIEYTLIQGVNDSRRDALQLANFLKGIPVKVNLIPLNEVPGIELRSPSDRVVDTFHDHLYRSGIRVFVRRQRGNDIAASCGQLALSMHSSSLV